MVNLVNYLTQLPVTAVCMGLIVLLGICMQFKLPMVIISVVILGALSLIGVSMPWVCCLAVGCLVLSLPFIRAQVVSRWILLATQVLHVFPKVSDTERAALEAGTVWMDKQLFSGDPNIATLMRQPVTPLRPDEQAFLDGPVAELCRMVNDWEIQSTRVIPSHIWTFIKDHRFLGMIIPKTYGGLELSAIGHSRVIEKIASVSPALAITVMVPNSLGPAELLLHYGTQVQKDRYLAALATGNETPCFGLTEPMAGSDAGGLQSDGVVFRHASGALYIRFNWNKRWITLSGISTVIGLAFLLKDPDQLLGGPTEYGITCALIPTNTPGVDVSRRHDPLGVPFYNCPTTGHDVEMPIDCVIGESAGYGKGWRMLMDCLSAGRGISLPSLSTGGAQRMTRAATAFGVIRQQFGMSIGQFEGIEEPMARIIGQTFILKATQYYTCGALDQGEKPSVISAILKLHSTEMFRDIVEDTMDIMGGAGITQGPRNIPASSFKAAPIGITVEGANILTRTLIIFGQGALRCHPYAYQEIVAAETNNVSAFDRAFFGHVYHMIRNTVLSVVRTLTRGALIPHYGGILSPYKRKLVWVSAIFSVLADGSMIYFGGALKAKQKITGRLGDILSNMYLVTAVMAYYESLSDGQKGEIKPVVQWACQHCFAAIQTALIGFFDNFSCMTRYTLSPWFRLFSVGSAPSDDLGKRVVAAIQYNPTCREWFTKGVHMPPSNQNGLGKLDSTYHQLMHVQPILNKIKAAVRRQQLPKSSIEVILPMAVKAGLIQSEDAALIKAANDARMDAIQVDAFTLDEYLKQA